MDFPDNPNIRPNRSGEIPLDLSVDTHWIWTAFTSEPAIGVMIVTPDARVVYTNEQTAQMVSPGSKAQDLIGHRWQEYMPKDWFDEWGPVLTRVALTARPVIKRGVWRGTQYYSSIRPLHSEFNAVEHLLVVSRAVPSSEEAAFLASNNEDVLDATGVHLGPLDILTSRELEVLALIGQGLSTEQIALTLHRSPETIKTHRKSLVDKLGTSDRAMLMRFASRAGLRLSDAAVPRVHNDHDTPKPT